MRCPGPAPDPPVFASRTSLSSPSLRLDAADPEAPLALAPAATELLLLAEVDAAGNDMLLLRSMVSEIMKLLLSVCNGQKGDPVPSPVTRGPEHATLPAGYPLYPGRQSDATIEHVDIRLLQEPKRHTRLR